MMSIEYRDIEDVFLTRCAVIRLTESGGDEEYAGEFSERCKKVMEEAAKVTDIYQVAKGENLANVALEMLIRMSFEEGTREAYDEAEQLDQKLIRAYRDSLWRLEHYVPIDWDAVRRQEA